MPEVREFVSRVLANGDMIELYEPPSSGEGAMRSGHCPRCGKSTKNYAGRCATIRTRKASGDLYWASTSRNYGHLNCMLAEFSSLVNDDDAVRVSAVENVSSAISWTYGTLAAMNAVVQAGLVIGMVDYDATRHRSKRCRWTVVTSD